MSPLRARMTEDIVLSRIGSGDPAGLFNALYI